MSRTISNNKQLALTAAEWVLVMMALDSYQHHAAFRDLHGKVAVLVKEQGSPSHLDA